MDGGANIQPCRIYPTSAETSQSVVSLSGNCNSMMREGADNIFTDSSAAAISMGFLAFISLAVSALISGYKLSTQTHI
ncbi:hypothetical protein POTOM_025276 [Populus tomentosa]|uniref:CASP-like protein n=1 Tax=Populus tomentosa TaxID=118781 RepID=A0A8X7ZNU4_POPTO|nr:hypothetical protein POTOM_025276 [Populus tomentosa]